jgi:hypothetical protein
VLALTIHQPWAWAIVHESKRVENREWSPPREVIGEYIAIHAGAVPRTKKAHAEMGNVAREIGAPTTDRLVFGAVIGVARVVRVLHAEPRPSSPHFAWWVGPIGWELDNVFALDTPLQCRGQRKLWPVPDSLLTSIRAQWKARGGKTLSYEEEERLALQDPNCH